jgi:S1-C subfamily serine protease
MPVRPLGPASSRDTSARAPAVTAVGHANGTGTLSASADAVSALNQTLTTSSEGSTAGETLDGLIEIDADVISGDSGGAVENSDGDVVGVTTAATSGTATVTGYPMPIGTAVRIAKQIVAGDDTTEITIGLPAFLGVSLSGDTGSAVIEQVLCGTAAAKSDLAAGDTITAIDGTTITSGDDLSAAIAKHVVDDWVTVTYTGTDGASHTTTVTLTAGPAD